MAERKNTEFDRPGGYATPRGATQIQRESAAEMPAADIRLLGDEVAPHVPAKTLTMVRSPGFGSITSDKRPIQARFHCGSSIHCLNLPLLMSRRLILQQARSQTFSRPPTACKLTVS